jgi:hypothetical protein
MTPAQLRRLVAAVAVGIALVSILHVAEGASVSAADIGAEDRFTYCCKAVGFFDAMDNTTRCGHQDVMLKLNHAQESAGGASGEKALLDYVKCLRGDRDARECCLSSVGEGPEDLDHGMG